MTGTSYPERIQPDAIVEALFELRFSAPGDFPEVTIGRLMASPLWESFSRTRLPTADIPHALRAADPNLAVQPTVELRNAEGTRLVRLGDHVLSFHVLGLGHYPGWAEFSQEIAQVASDTFGRLGGAPFDRLGLRYVNALMPDKHLISGLSDTNIAVTRSGQPLADAIGLNYQRLENDHRVVVRMATPSMIRTTGIPAGYSLLIDIDVSTQEGKKYDAVSEALAWLELAHAAEKKEFFSMLPRTVIEKLTA